MENEATETRLVNIEIKMTVLEDLVQTLNDQVYQQQKQIEELRAVCTALVKRLEEGVGNDGGADSYQHERPPHY